MSRIAIAIVPGLALALAGLAACSTAGNNVVSAGEVAGAAADAATSLSAADAVAVREKVVGDFVDCLVAAGVPAFVGLAEVDGVNYPEVRFDGSMVSRTDPDSGLGDSDGLVASMTVMVDAAGEVAVDQTKQLDVFAAARAGHDLALVVDTVDYSQAYGECYLSSGYTALELGSDLDPAEELRNKQAVAAVSNQWATCARDNGYPEVKDAAAPVADGYDTQPMALLPATITAAQLRALLEVCPNFEAEAFEAAMNPTPGDDGPGIGAGAQGGGAVLVAGPSGAFEMPLIGFDAPGYDGTAGGAALDQATVDRLDALQEILSEKWMEYIETQAGQGAVVVGQG